MRGQFNRCSCSTLTNTIQHFPVGVLGFASTSQASGWGWDGSIPSPSQQSCLLSLRAGLLLSASPSCDCPLPSRHRVTSQLKNQMKFPGGLQFLWCTYLLFSLSFLFCFFFFLIHFFFFLSPVSNLLLPAACFEFSLYQGQEKFIFCFPVRCRMDSPPSILLHCLLLK